MARLYRCTGEVKIVSPQGTVQIDVSKQGVVYVIGADGDGQPVQRDKWQWYLDQIKAAREAIRFGKAPAGFKVGGTEPVVNKDWYLKMFECGYGAVWRGRGESRVLQAAVGPTPIGNGLVFIPGKRR